MRAFTRRSPQREEALGAEAPAGVARGKAALAQPQLVVGAPRHRVVALARIERPFDHVQRLDQFGDDEVGVGVAVAVQVPTLVDGNAPDRELDVLPLARVESAHEDLLGMPFAALVGQENAGRQLEQFGGIGARNLGKLVDPQSGNRTRPGWAADGGRAR